ncbi:MAG: hypothetical protein N4A45_09700 [Flavobacteriales bacterium]|jgi:hypothetical protein|nr:hypothetical protein [Flavobacteriales bacterium]
MLLSLEAVAQEKKSQLDYQFGAGMSFLGSGDISTILFENEVNYKINQYFSSSIGINIAKRNGHHSVVTASFLQGNLNAFFSPFKNNNKYNFRFGGGCSLMDISYNTYGALKLQNGIVQGQHPKLINKTILGFNIIIENSYTIKEKYIIGFKLFTQPFYDGNINSGSILKMGIKI